MGTRRWLLPWCIAVACVVGIAAIALADAIPRPPRRCVRGAHPVATHEGARCEPDTTCDAEAIVPDLACRNGAGHHEDCVPTALCVVHRQGTPGFDDVVGTCGAHDRCRAGATCVHQNRCEPRPSRPGDRHVGS